MAEMGNLYVIAAPSGTGKTTLVKALTELMAKVTVSISHTTRPRRPNEMHGVNYYYVDKQTFERMILEHHFLEHAVIFDHYYGTSKQWVEETLAKGMDVILEIDWQGYQQIKRLFSFSIGIFILPPSMEELRERLIKRNQDDPTIIKKRLVDTKETVSHIKEFDYIILNEDFEKALYDLQTIMTAGRLLTRCQFNHYSKLIENLDMIE